MSDLHAIIDLLLLPVTWCGAWQIGTWIGKALIRRNGWYEQTEWVRRDRELYDPELDHF
jgi:hypothetical protein